MKGAATRAVYYTGPAAAITVGYMMYSTGNTALGVLFMLLGAVMSLAWPIARILG